MDSVWLVKRFGREITVCSSVQAVADILDETLEQEWNVFNKSWLITICFELETASVLELIKQKARAKLLENTEDEWYLLDNERNYFTSTKYKVRHAEK